MELNTYRVSYITGLKRKRVDVHAATETDAYLLALRTIPAKERPLINDIRQIGGFSGGLDTKLNRGNGEFRK